MPYLPKCAILDCDMQRADLRIRNTADRNEALPPIFGVYCPEHNEQFREEYRGCYGLGCTNLIPDGGRITRKSIGDTSLCCSKCDPASGQDYVPHTSADPLSDYGIHATFWRWVRYSDPVACLRHRFFDLFTFTEPERWFAARDANLYRWIDNAICMLTPRQQSLLCADVVERILPYWDRYWPEERRIHLAVQATRAWGEGTFEPDNPEAAHALHTIKESAMAAWYPYDMTDRWRLGMQQAAEAIAEWHITGVLNKARRAIYDLNEQIDSDTTSDDSSNPPAEALWQWDRIVYYLNAQENTRQEFSNGNAR